MRARLTGIGILAAAGLLIGTVVHRQARSSDPSVDAAGWASPRVGSQGLLLADGFRFLRRFAKNARLVLVHRHRLDERQFRSSRRIVTNAKLHAGWFE